MSRETHIRHATCVAIAGAGVLLLGPSGAGKSDLALRLIDAGGGCGGAAGGGAGAALLVADDAVALSIGADGVVTAAAPARLAGLLEVRGVGILPVPHVDSAPLRLAVRLGAAPERLPEPERLRLDVGGRVAELPLIHLAGFEASAPAKLRLALAAVLATGPTIGLPAVPGVPDRFERVP